ncbi:hypothetical protein [Clostridium sp. Cult2]|uniref:hypothetical protein n=1 Tax=Clostridium sp. Cult2 TaxID=2079003 RepID=UPI001F3CE25E|nr:hypothetical protein [Clostridium sp. Cult2]MCF6464353.1 hypothetical protein [Clostridium sp. Cult2]
MEQIVEGKKKSFIKIFSVIIGFVILIDFIIYIMNRYIEELSPYVANISVIFLVVISCSFILIKYFSKYSYTLEKEHLTFHRVIGKRRFQILRIDYFDLIGIFPYREEDEKYTYNFTFDKEGEDVYIGQFIDNNRRISFLFTPNEEILKRLKRMLKNKE